MRRLLLISLCLGSGLIVIVLVYARRPESLAGSGGLPYRRIVSLVPSVTELLFAVGAGDQVVGVTAYCDYPPEARTKERIGALHIDIEKVVALQPDVIMTVRRMTRETSAALERMGFRVEEVYGESFAEIAEAMRRLGRMTGHVERAEEAAREFLDRVNVVEGRVRGKARPTIFFESSADPIWTVGGQSYVGDLIERAGGTNVMADMAEAWGPVSWEVVLARDPDILLIAHDQVQPLGIRAGWSGLKAVKSNRVHVVPQEKFIYPTPRLVEGLEMVAELLHGAK